MLSVHVHHREGKLQEYGLRVTIYKQIQYVFYLLHTVLQWMAWTHGEVNNWKWNGLAELLTCKWWVYFELLYCLASSVLYS